MKRKFGIRAKLMVGTLPIIFLAFVVVVVIAYNSSKGSIEQKTEKLLESDAATCVNRIVAWENDNLGVPQNGIRPLCFFIPFILPIYFRRNPFVLMKGFRKIEAVIKSHRISDSCDGQL